LLWTVGADIFRLRPWYQKRKNSVAATTTPAGAGKYVASTCNAVAQRTKAKPAIFFDSIGKSI